MARRIAAIIFIFICSTVAWMILGATIFARTYDTDSRLRGRVASNWGSAQQQDAPRAEAVWREMKRVLSAGDDGKQVLRNVEETVSQPLSLERTRARVDLALEHRQKGLLWYSTYVVGFTGDYTFRNTTDKDSVTVTLAFPGKDAIYDVGEPGHLRQEVPGQGRGGDDQEQRELDERGPSRRPRCDGAARSRVSLAGTRPMELQLRGQRLRVT